MTTRFHSKQIDNKYEQNICLIGFLFFSLTISIFLIICVLNSPRTHFKNIENVGINIQDREIKIYQNIGMATKAIFFHEMKKQKP